MSCMHNRYSTLAEDVVDDLKIDGVVLNRLTVPGVGTGAYAAGKTAVHNVNRPETLQCREYIACTVLKRQYLQRPAGLPTACLPSPSAWV